MSTVACIADRIFLLIFIAKVFSLIQGYVQFVVVPFLMAAMICCSTEFKWTTSAIIDSIRVTEVPTGSTNFSEG
jgi:hypothetical protein